MAPEPSSPDEPEADYESTPLSRSEYIAAVVHLYRGELYRANSWRIRLDNTTNWAVLTVAGLLTFTFGEGAHSHWVLLLGLAILLVFHGFEARRYRSWHVWRSRVRMIEENFYGPILRRDPVSPDHSWGELVARDLFHPTFKIGRLEAMRARLTRNYWALYLAVFGAWVLKVLTLPQMVENELTLRERLADGMVPWWAAPLYLALFLGVMGALLLVRPAEIGEEHVTWRRGEDGAERVPMDL
ncbi:MAG: DUF2270 domain-containing protein [Planctomycetota bacterium]